MAHKWAKWLPHPCRIGDPHRFRAGGKIRSRPQEGKLATSPLPSRGSPPLQSGGQNLKWPTNGQNGYLTPAVSGDPRCFRAGGKIRSGPQVGKMATSPLPYRGSPPLQSGGQNQKSPTRGKIGYLTAAVSGIPAASERGAKSQVAHKWAKWLPPPCRIGDLHRFRAGGKIRSRPQEGKLATSPLPSRGSPPLQSGGQNHKWPTSGQNGYLTPAVSGDPRCFRAGGKIRSGPQVGKMATSPLPYRGSPPLQSGGQNQKSPTRGKIGYLTAAVSGIPAASERGAKSQVAHKWAKRLPHPCRIGDPHRFRAGGKIRSRPQEGKLATSPLPSRGSPPLQSGGQNQKWPTSGQNGYLTPAVSGIPTASERQGKSEAAHKRENWLPHPCRLGDPRRFRAGGKIRSGPQMGKMATSPLPYRGIPAASERGAKSEVAHKWAKWLPHPCRIGGSPLLQSGGQNQKSPTRGARWLPPPCRIRDPRRFRAGGKIRSRPQEGKLATSPLPYRGSPPLQSGGQNQKWPTSGQNGYLPPAVSGIPTALERGARSEVARKRENWLPHPAVSGIPTASERGAKSEVAHKWAKWLPHPCRIGDPRRF